MKDRLKKGPQHIYFNVCRTETRIMTTLFYLDPTATSIVDHFKARKEFFFILG